jgi:hypothetical protein
VDGTGSGKDVSKSSKVVQTEVEILAITQNATQTLILQTPYTSVLYRTSGSVPLVLSLAGLPQSFHSLLYFMGFFGTFVFLDPG